MQALPSLQPLPVQPLTQAPELHPAMIMTQTRMIQPRRISQKNPFLGLDRLLWMWLDYIP